MAGSKNSCIFTNKNSKKGTKYNILQNINLNIIGYLQQ